VHFAAAAETESRNPLFLISSFSRPEKSCYALTFYRFCARPRCFGTKGEGINFTRGSGCIKFPTDTCYATFYFYKKNALGMSRIKSFFSYTWNIFWDSFYGVLITNIIAERVQKPSKLIQQSMR
jgi:hypothetical protein